jgi:predicted RNase H-like HicB family nuclease
MTRTATLNLSIDVVLEPDEGGFHAYCPALKGLHVDGATEKEAIENVRDAVSVYLDSLALHGDPLPLCTHLTVTEVQRHMEAPELLRSITVPWPILQTSGIS